MREVYHITKEKVSLELPDTPPCAGQTDVFYPSIDDVDRSETHTVLEQSKAAKRVCNSCPFKRECLDTALANNEKYGIWGGVNFGNKREYAELRRKMRARKAS